MKYEIHFVDATTSTHSTPEERDQKVSRLVANGLLPDEDFFLVDIPDDTKGD